MMDEFCGLWVVTSISIFAFAFGTAMGVAGLLSLINSKRWLLIGILLISMAITIICLILAHGFWTGNIWRGAE